MSEARIISGWMVLGVGILLTVLALGAAWLVHRSAVVTGISVEGQYITSESQIVAQTGISEGTPSDSIHYLSVIERLETLPWIEKAHIAVSPGGRIRVRVDEQQPMARIPSGRRSVFLTAGGLVLPSEPGKPIDVPVVRGIAIQERSGEHVLPDTLSGPEFEMLRDFLTQARYFPALHALISEVWVSRQDGIRVVTGSPSLHLRIGHDEFDDALQRWQTFHGRVLATQIETDIQTLDLRFRGQVVAR